MTVRETQQARHERVMLGALASTALDLERVSRQGTIDELGPWLKHHPKCRREPCGCGLTATRERLFEEGPSSAPGKVRVDAELVEMAEAETSWRRPVEPKVPGPGPGKAER